MGTRGNLATNSVTDITRLAEVATATDDELVAAWRAGDESAFGQLVDRYGAPVHGFLRRLVGDPRLAEDAWSETWLSVIRARDQYQPDGQFRAWVYTLARRCAVDEQRKRGRWSRLTSRFKRLSDPTPATRGPESSVRVSSRGQRLDAALLQLTESHHTIVVLAYRQGLSAGEIGEVMGMTGEQVQSRLAYARRLLKQLLDTEDLDV